MKILISLFTVPSTDPGPDAVSSVHDLLLRATLTNTGDETLQLLNEPRTALSKRSTDNFVIRHASGFRPRFVGLNVMSTSPADMSADVV